MFRNRLVFSSVLAMSVLALGACATTVPADPEWGDAQIAMVARVANEGEVREGELARARAASSAVRDFASMMVNDHAAANERVAAAVAGASITPVENMLSREMQANAARSVENLGSWSGADFDRRYMDHQIALHQYVLSTIDAKLVPHSQNRQLRAVLTDMRTSVAAHLEQARQIRGTL